MHLPDVEHTVPSRRLNNGQSVAEQAGQGAFEVAVRIGDCCFDLKGEEDWTRLEGEWKIHVLETLRKEALERDRRRPG